MTSVFPYGARTQNTTQSLRGGLPRIRKLSKTVGRENRTEWTYKQISYTAANWGKVKKDRHETYKSTTSTARLPEQGLRECEQVEQEGRGGMFI